VLVDTSKMARQMQELYRIDETRIGVVPVAVDVAFSTAAADGEAEAAALRELGIESPYLLFLGTLLERRSPRLMLEVFRSLLVDRPQLVLVLAGANRMRSPARLDHWIRELGLDDRVVRLGYVEERSLPVLYRRAELSFFLSSYEGFGIPPLESLACGTPAVVGTGLALDELWPDYPFRCSELHHSEVLDVTRRALADGPGREGALKAAPGVLRRVAWEEVSRSFVSEVRRAVAA
jgi:glycosyltransferase involved in cell wall biosynthesis